MKAFDKNSNSDNKNHVLTRGEVATLVQKVTFLLKITENKLEGGSPTLSGKSLSLNLICFSTRVLAGVENNKYWLQNINVAQQNTMRCVG